MSSASIATSALNILLRVRAAQRGGEHAHHRQQPESRISQLFSLVVPSPIVVAPLRPLNEGPVPLMAGALPVSQTALLRRPPTRRRPILPARRSRNGKAAGGRLRRDHPEVDDGILLRANHDASENKVIGRHRKAVPVYPCRAVDVTLPVYQGLFVGPNRPPYPRSALPVRIRTLIHPPVPSTARFLRRTFLPTPKPRQLRVRRRRAAPPSHRCHP